CPAWGPDGQAIAFIRFEPQKPESLRVVAPDGTGEKVLVTNIGRAAASGPAWSPDGTEIAYTAETPYGLQLFLIPAAGGTPRQLTHLPGLNIHPVWLSNDRLLFSHVVQLNAFGGGYGAINRDGTRLENHPLARTERAHSMIRPAVSLPRPAAKPEAN